MRRKNNDKPIRPDKRKIPKLFRAVEREDDPTVYHGYLVSDTTSVLSVSPVIVATTRTSKSGYSSNAISVSVRSTRSTLLSTSTALSIR